MTEDAAIHQKNQPEQGVLAFPVESRSDAPKAIDKGTETRMAKRQSESLAGTERLMSGRGGGVTRPPMPILSD